MKIGVTFSATDPNKLGGHARGRISSGHPHRRRKLTAKARVETMEPGFT